MDFRAVPEAFRQRAEMLYPGQHILDHDTHSRQLLIGRFLILLQGMVPPRLVRCRYAVLR